MAGLITQALLTKLGTNLEDVQGTLFDPDIKLGAFNEAQISVANMLHNSYLTDFQDIALAVPLETDKQYALLSRINGGNIFKGVEGIVAIKVNLGGTNDKVRWSTVIELADMANMTTGFYEATDDRPRHYMYASMIHFLMATYVSTKIDVLYLKTPVDMSLTVDPVLNSSFHNILLAMAEANCWKVDNKSDRMASALTLATEQIKVLNARVAPIKSGK